MTLIVYRDGIMAADMVVWQGGSVFSGSRRKIARRADGTMWASTGTTSRCVQFSEAMQKWDPDERGYLQCPACENEDAFASLIVRPDGTVWRTDGRMVAYEAPPAEFHAIGAATMFLLGALAAGANAVAAIRLAQLYTDAGVRTCPEIQIEKLAP